MLRRVLLFNLIKETCEKLTGDCMTITNSQTKRLKLSKFSLLISI